MGKIFISHSSANNAEALAIHDWLAAQGWGDVFLDLDPRRGLVAGDRWQAALKAAAEQCELILILISPDWAKSRWCLAEFLLAKQMNKQILGVLARPTPLADLPVELTAEWQLVDLSAPDTGWTTTIAPPRLEPETTVSFSGTGLARLAAGLQKAGLDATNFNWPPESDPDRAPYRGLLPLDADDAGIFFGRDGATILTLDALRGLRAAAAPRFATILGASGAGKSSFLRAGLLPRLARDSQHFRVLPIIRPERAALTGEHGFAAMLEVALKARNITRNRADLRAAVGQGADAVHPLLRQLIAGDPGDATDNGPPTLVIAVDQAEELLGADNNEAGAFLTLLADLAKADDPALLVILTVRSDSFDQLQSRPELADTQPHHLVDLPPIPFGAFGDVIRGPARRMSAAGRKLTVDEPLVDALLADIEQGGAKDALPLLAFTLERLFRDYGADGDLQLSEYNQLGRIRGAIEAAVEQALSKADNNPAIPRDRAARLALLRRGLIPWLAGIDPVTGSPRRRVARLAEVPAEARPLIELMVAERLLSTDIDKPTGEQTIEPAHEALLRQWGALDGWLVEDSADLSLLESLRRAATDWDANARGPEYLAHKGARLTTAEQVAAQDKFATYLTSIDRAYLAAGRAAENAALAKARAARMRTVIAAAIAGVVLVTGLTAGFFVQRTAEAAKTEAAANFAMAQSEAALRAGKPEQGAVAALTAYDILPTPATRTAALTAAMSVSPNTTAIFAVSGRIADTAFLDPGHLVVLTGKGEVTMLDLPARKAAPGASVAADPLPIGLVAGRAGEVRVVFADASIGRLDGSVVAAAPAEMFFARAGTVKASADGKVVAMGGLVGDVLVRDCRSLPCIDAHLTAPSELGEGKSAGAIAVKPDGSAIAVNWPHAVAVYTNLAAAPLIIALPHEIADMGMASAMDWSAVTDRIALTTDSGALVILDPRAQTPLHHLQLGLTSRALEWSPTRPLIALDCDDKTICLYRDDFIIEAAFTGHTSAITSIHWSPDGKRLSSFAPNDPVRIWSLADDPRVASGLRADGWPALTSLAIDRTRNVVAAGDELGTLWIWLPDMPAGHIKIPDIDAAITSLAILADGRIAAVYENTAIAVWTLGRPKPDKLVMLDNLSFSRVAALSGDIRAAVPLSDKTILTLSGDELRDSRVAPDSMPLDQWGLTAVPAANTAFVSYSDGTIRRRDLGAGGEGSIVFDARTSLCGAAPTTDNNGARSLDVSPDGKWLVTTRSDSAVIVHNLADPARPICIALPAPDSKTVAFSPDSTKLAILSATDRLYLFELAKPGTAIIFGAAAVPDNSPIAVAAGAARTTSWLAWRDDTTLLISTIAGTVESITLDPAGWRARVDSLFISP